MSSPLQLSRALLLSSFSKQGATLSSVAEELGCTPSAISQALASNPALAQEIAEKKLQANKQGAALDAVYDSLESTALERLGRTLPLVTDAMKLAKIAQMLNSAKRRGTIQRTEVPAGQQVVRLVLPATVAGHLQLSPQNEVVQVGGRELITMPSAQVQELAASHGALLNGNNSKPKGKIELKMGEIL